MFTLAHNCWKTAGRWPIQAVGLSGAVPRAAPWARAPAGMPSPCRPALTTPAPLGRNSKKTRLLSPIAHIPAYIHNRTNKVFHVEPNSDCAQRSTWNPSELLSRGQTSGNMLAVQAP